MHKLPFIAAVKYPGSMSKDLPPLPNSVIDSSGLHDYPSPANCVTNTQQEQPSTDYHWTGAGGIQQQEKPVVLLPDQWIKSLLGPYQLWLAKITVTRQAVHQFNITFIEGGQSIAVFGRHLDYPSITKHDWVEYVLSENRRYTSEARSVSAVLSEGSWYIGIYNDGESDLEFGLVLSYLASGIECLNNCLLKRILLPNARKEFLVDLVSKKFRTGSRRIKHFEQHGDIKSWRCLIFCDIYYF